MKKVTDMSGKMNERDGAKYRLLQTKALMELYRRDTGLECSSIAELEAWSKTRAGNGKPIDPSTVFSPEQIEQIERDAT